jgi:predicted transcriptional regulator of viral defense system
VHPLLRVAADRRGGVFTAIDARRAGYAHAEIRHLCASGRWHRLRRGVYVAADDLTRADEQGRRYQLECLAVLLAVDRPAAALSHLSAARLSGLRWRGSSDADVRLTDPQHNHRGRGFRVTRSPLDAEEIRTFGAFRLTAPARTLIDCAREGSLEDAVVAMDAGLLAG